MINYFILNVFIYLKIKWGWGSSIIGPDGGFSCVGSGTKTEVPPRVIVIKIQRFNL